MADPLSGDIFIVSKRDSASRIYRLPFPQEAGAPLIAEFIGALPLTYAVAGDISAAGTEILVKNYQEVFYWHRTPQQSIGAALLQPPARIPYTLEPQGEAICWRWNGEGFYTLSEETFGIEAHLYFYPRLPASVLLSRDHDEMDLRFLPALPNPFSQSTTLSFSVAESSDVTLTVYNEIGQQVAVLFQQNAAPGSYHVQWHAGSLGSGFYLCRLQTAKKTLVQKIQLMR